MVSGKYPFEFTDDGNILGLYESIISGIFPMPEGLNDDLKDLMNGILCKDALKRLNFIEIKAQK